MTDKERKSCIRTIEFLRGLAFNVHGVMDIIDAQNCDEIIKMLEKSEPQMIRCRECKYAEVADKEDTQDGYTCQFHRGSIWFSGSYCSWAERRIDDKTNKGSSC